MVCKQVQNEFCGSEEDKDEEIRFIKRFIHGFLSQAKQIVTCRR
jgi:hypothetical protein